MKRALISSFIVAFGCLLGMPVFAAPVASTIEAQAKQFHAALDTYDDANAELLARIEGRVGLNERARNFLLSLAKQEESELLTLRSKLWSASNTKSLKALVASAKTKREKMKRQETQIVVPLIELNELRVDLLPTATARLLSLEATVTKKQHDTLTSMLSSVEMGAVKLETQLLSAKPPTDAPAQVRKLQTRLKDYYSALRKIVK